MNFDQDNILFEIAEERERQDGLFGGSVHDDEHTIDAWCDLFDIYNAKLTGDLNDGPTWRRRLIETAALAVAAIESFDRAALTTSGDEVDCL